MREFVCMYFWCCIVHFTQIDGNWKLLCAFSSPPSPLLSLMLSLSSVSCHISRMVLMLLLLNDNIQTFCCCFLFSFFCFIFGCCFDFVLFSAKRNISQRAFEAHKHTLTQTVLICSVAVIVVVHHFNIAALISNTFDYVLTGASIKVACCCCYFYCLFFVLYSLVYLYILVFRSCCLFVHAYVISCLCALVRSQFMYFIYAICFSYSTIYFHAYARLEQKCSNETYERMVELTEICFLY